MSVLLIVNIGLDAAISKRLFGAVVPIPTLDVLLSTINQPEPPLFAWKELIFSLVLLNLKLFPPPDPASVNH